MSQQEEAGGAPAAPTAAAPAASGMGVLAALMAVLAWSVPSIMAKALPMEPVAIVLYRIWFGVAFGMGALWVQRGRLSLSGLKLTIPAGLFLAADLMCFFTAIKATTVANATIISNLQPLLLMFLAPLLFRERIAMPDIGAALLALGGVVFVVLGSAQSSAWSLRGDLWALATLLAWTAYFVAAKKARQKVGAVEFTAGVSVICALSVTPVALLSGSWRPPEAAWIWWSLVGMAAFGWLGHFMMNWALAHVPLWVGGNMALAIPVTTTVLAAVFLSEPFGGLQLIGMLVSAAGLGWIGLRSTRTPAPAKPLAAS